MNPFIRLARAISENRGRSEVKTVLVPLDRIRTAVFFLDADSPKIASAISIIKTWCLGRNIHPTIYAVCRDGLPKSLEGVSDGSAVLLRGRSLSFFGSIRKFRNTDDLFVDMTDGTRYCVLNAAIRSRAIMKVGRRQQKGEIMDFVLAASEGKTPAEVFNAITNILSKIQ